MKPSRRILGIGTAAVCVLFVLYCMLDPTEPSEELSDALQKGVYKVGMHMVERSFGGFPDQYPADRIPLWIQYHPRRFFSSEWKKEYVGINPGIQCYGIAKDTERVDVQINHLKLRACSVDIYSNKTGHGAAQLVGKMLREQYRLLPVRVHAADDSHNRVVQ